MPSLRRRALAPWAVAFALLLTVAGCASDPVDLQPNATPPPSTTAAAQELTPEQEALFGPRVELPGGLLLKQYGNVAQWGGPNDTDPATFGARIIVDSIEVDPDDCREYMPEPERGHYLVISVRVETSATYSDATDGGPYWHMWGTIGADGVSEDSLNSNLSCREATAFADEMRPSSMYRGEITVDTVNPTGRAVLLNFAAWDYPAAS